MKFFSSSELPKLPTSIGRHPQGDLIFSLRHIVAEYCNARSALGTTNPMQIACVQEALKTLGGTFHAIAQTYQHSDQQIAGEIFEKGNRYYDLANGD